MNLGAGVKNDGQVLFLRDIQVVLNPDSILRAVVPILLTTPIDVDLGTYVYSIYKYISDFFSTLL